MENFKLPPYPIFANVDSFEHRKWLQLLDESYRHLLGIGGVATTPGSISDLRDLSSNGTPQAFVLGYYTAGDGGGGMYWLDTADTTSTDNGGTIIVSNDGGRWKLIQFGPVSVKQFGAKGDWNGSSGTNDAFNIQNAMNSHLWLYFPNGSYFIGSAGVATAFVEVSNRTGLKLETGDNVKIVMTTTANVINYGFTFQTCDNLELGTFQFEDTGYNSAITWKGSIGCQFRAVSGTPWGNIQIDGILATKMVSPFVFNGNFANARIKGVHIKLVEANDTYYATLFQDNGDGVVIDKVVANLCYRSYFAFGVTDHRATINSTNNRGTSGSVNISRGVGGLNTSSIHIKYFSRDNTNDIPHVLVNHIDLLGGEIFDIHIDLDIQSAVLYYPIRFVNYSGSGGPESNAASLNKVYDIVVRGTCDVQARPIEVFASYNSKGLLDFTAGNNFTFNTTIPPAFYLGRTGVVATSTWSSTGVQPVLGNGTLSMDYSVVDGICHVNVTLIAGNTTTFGTGSWQFSVPFISRGTCVGSAWALDSGTAFYLGAARATTGSSLITLVGNNTPAAFSSTVPFAWANADQLVFTIAYPIQ